MDVCGTGKVYPRCIICITKYNVTIRNIYDMSYRVLQSYVCDWPQYMSYLSSVMRSQKIFLQKDFYITIKYSTNQDICIFIS